MCWGLGEKGQRGDGTFTQYVLTPAAVQGLTNATALSGGYNHACALVADATLRCWGSNAQGQLGNPSITGSAAAPVAVPNVSGALAVSAGAFHTCVVLSDQTARCWGRNDSGQLGDGTYTTSFTPVTVSGLSTSDISGGSLCAVLTDGRVQCWGRHQGSSAMAAAFRPRRRFRHRYHERRPGRRGIRHVPDGHTGAAVLGERTSGRGSGAMVTSTTSSPCPDQHRRRPDRRLST